ncbi:MAG TPA: nitronate monooxygenase [Candidatus Dormibacteraeota bacterium]|nr:nitronate monooxygenase [Candidatus Dormibacteraeota bacterium]
MNGFPAIFQGGMGAGISNWRLAGAVSSAGQLGIVSGTALDQIFARRLQDGDPGGHMRRGVEHFPFQHMVEQVWKKYYIPGGRASHQPYKTIPMPVKLGDRRMQILCMVANFVEVFLAREGHDNPVGINYLEKVQLPHLASIYGAMLAGVGAILMGAGIAIKIPDVLDRFIHHEPATYPLTVTGADERTETTLRFAPRDLMECDLPPLRRPKFVAIVASNTLATTMVKKTGGRVDGFVVEGPTAGGHNAPPRGRLQLDAAGNVIYGERDIVDLEKMRALGVPFWLAGGYGSAEGVRAARLFGAHGVQVGTAFAFCEESGLRDDYKRALLADAVAERVTVRTDSLASPTGFPFKIALLAGSLSEEKAYEERVRICDLGYLREAYTTPTGKIGYRCPSEPLQTYVAKGGNMQSTIGRKCICNALLATVGLPQLRADGSVEAGIVTAGDDLAELGRFLSPGRVTYTAADVIDTLSVEIS